MARPPPTWRSSRCRRRCCRPRSWWSWAAASCSCVGWQTRLAALALAAFCILAALLFHTNFADRNQLLHFQKDLAIAGGLLALFALGAGRLSVEGIRRR